MAKGQARTATEPRRTPSRLPRSDRVVELISAAGRITDLPPERRTWFVVTDVRPRLAAGEPTVEPIRIPQQDADRLLRGFVRFVADIPARASLQMVWEHGHNELLVDAGTIGLTCSAGLLTVSVSVGCDELARPTRVAVPFATGSVDSPRGLLMSTLTRVDAPAIVADAWSDPIVAFCWEALLEVARRVCAQAGHDRSGLPLIPGAVAAEDGLLLVHPMARNNLTGLTNDRRRR
jgi:hypothetical protein